MTSKTQGTFSGDTYLVSFYPNLVTAHIFFVIYWARLQYLFKKQDEETSAAIQYREKHILMKLITDVKS